MADLSRKKISNGNGMKTKGDVFASQKKFRVDDYTEIFGGKGSSIPILDLPAVDEDDDGLIDVRSDKFDYSEVFGGFNSVDFAVSYEELLAEAKRDGGDGGGGETSSEEAWTPAETGSPSEGSSEEPLCPKNNQAFTNGESHHAYDDVKQFSMSYHKVSQTSKEDGINGTTHIAHLNAVPAFTFIVDEVIPLQEEKCDKSSSLEAIDDYWRVNSNGGVIEGKHFQETRSEESSTSGTVSRNPKSANCSGELEENHFQKTIGDGPSCNVFSKTGRSDLKTEKNPSGNGIHVQKTMPEEPAHDTPSRISSDLKPERNPSGNGTYSGEEFLTVSEISLRTKPCHVPPPSRPPPKVAIKQGDSKGWMTSKRRASVNYAREGAKSDSPHFFDVEVDASSSAAASAAAMKEAMEKAQATLKCAKESMQRKRDGLQNRKKLGLKEDIKGNQRKDGDIVDAASRIKESISHEKFERKEHELKGFDSELRQRARGAAKEAPDFEMKAGTLNSSQESAVQNSVKEHILTQKSHKMEGAGEWKAEDQFYELVQKDKVKVKAEAPEQKTRETKLERTEVQEHKQNEKISETMACEQKEENAGKLQAAVIKAQLQEDGKVLKVAKEMRDWKEHEKKFKESLDMGESEKKLREEFEREEHEKKLREAREQKEQEKLLQEAHEKEKHEKKLKEALEMEAYEKKLREIQQREENERKLKESRQQKENEMKEEESCQREENANRLKEAHEMEEYEKKLAYQGEDHEKKLKESLHDKESEMKEEYTQREENEERQKEASIRVRNEKTPDEAYGCEEIVKKLREVQELQENEIRQKQSCEENERRLREVHELEEKEKRQREAFEQEKKVKLLKEAHEREENERKLREFEEQKENEKRKKEVVEQEKKVKLEKEEREWKEIEQRLRELEEQKENEKRQKEDYKMEENKNKLKEDDEQEEAEKRQNVACEREEYEKLKVSQEAHICKSNEQHLKPVNSYQEVAESELKSMETNVTCTEYAGTSCRAANGACEEDENSNTLKVAQEYWEYADDGKMMKTTEIASELKENELKIASEHGECERLREPCMAQSSREQEFCENKKEIASKGELDISEKKKSVELEEAVGQEKYEKFKLTEKASLEENKIKQKSDQGLSTLAESGNNMEAAHQSGSLEEKREKVKISNEFIREEREKERKLLRERDQEKERIRKIEEDRERAREREREKDRMAVERATREARERAFAEARERAERAAVERATAEVRQRALAEARERLEKASAEAREKSLAERASVEARLRAERAAVERATTEARERAVEKAMAEKAAFAARERVERSVSEKFSATSRDNGLRHSTSFSDFRDSQFQSSTSFNSSQRYTSSSNHGAFVNEKPQGPEVESAQRCKARLERHQRTVERAAKALAEKNKRDFLAQREQAERHRLAETLDADVKRWSNGKEGNLRALLSTLQYILGTDSGWQPIPLTEVITAVAVKKAYRKATLCVHPDKLQQRGASIQQKYICEKVFDLLKEAWNKFNSEER